MKQYFNILYDKVKYCSAPYYANVSSTAYPVGSSTQQPNSISWRWNIGLNQVVNYGETVNYGEYPDTLHVDKQQYLILIPVPAQESVATYNNEEYYCAYALKASVKLSYSES